jgi:integrase
MDIRNQGRGVHEREISGLEQAERLFRLGIRVTADQRVIAQADGTPLLIRVTADQRVIAQADGTPLQPNSLTHAFTDFIAARGLRRVRFHDLRHSHATHMLGAGVHPKIASERLGHSKVGITLDLYSHVLPGMQDEAAAQVNALISGEIDRHRAAAPKKIR